MQTIAAKIQVNADRTVTLQLPADVQMGEYDAVLVLNSRSGENQILTLDVDFRFYRVADRENFNIIQV